MNTLLFKKVGLLTAAITLAIVAANAQEEPKSKTGPDSTKGSSTETIVFPMNGGKMEIKFTSDSSQQKDTSKKVWIHNPTPRDFWSGFDIGFNGYLTPDQKTTMTPGNENFEVNQGKSVYMGFNFIEKSMPIYKTHVVLLTGLGLDYNNYKFSNNVSPFGDVDSSGQGIQRDYTQNRLKTFYATVPLMLGIDFSKPHKSGLHLAMGVVGGVRVGSYTKEKYSEGSDVIKKNTRGEHGLNPFRVNAQARVGYGDFTLFASYALTEMFRDNVGKPELYPFNFGISFSG